MPTRPARADQTLKKSGIGREKGLEALDSYLRTKNVAIDLSEGGGPPGA